MLSFDSASASVPDSTDWLSTPLASLAPLESELRCQVCKDFFNTPMMTSCSHTFCSLCIRRYLSQEGRCPACRTADQELKLRRNWVVEELVNRFVEGRGGLLEFARNSAELERKRLDEDDSPRPKKRRKVQAPRTRQPEGAPGAERRSTRSRSRRDTAQASQDSTKELVVADSDDAGSEYEDEDSARSLRPGSVRPATKPHQAQEEPVDGLVACPGCGKRMKEEVVFTHLDRCTSSGGSEVPDKQAPVNGVLGPSQHPRASIAYIPPDSLFAGKARERLPTLAYSMLNDAALRKKLQALGIPSQGPKLLLQKRHTEWVNLWNANCDSRDPKPKRKLLEELDVWERTQRKQILQGMHTAAGGGQGTGVMAKDFDGESWMRGNKNDFDELVRRAREKKATAPHADDGQKEPESGSTSKNTAQQIFPNANAPPDTNAVASDMVSDPEPRAGTRASTAKSPFFDKPTERETKTEPPGAKLMSSASELSVDVEQSQSHGSHVNGVIA